MSLKKNEVFEVLNEAYFGNLRHEDDVLKLLPKLLKKCDIFVDVGASLGTYTKEATDHLKNRQIYSIEADPLRFDGLKKKVEQLQKNNNNNEIIAIHGAVGDSNESLTFFTDSTNTSGSLTTIEGRVSSENFVSVQGYKIDTLIDVKDKAILVKIDVEGAEYSVVEGMSELLKRNKVELLIELHSWGDKRTNKYPHHLLLRMMLKGFHLRKIYDHYYFSKSKKILGDKKSYLVEIAYLWLKANLRKVKLVRKFYERLKRNL